MKPSTAFSKANDVSKRLDQAILDGNILAGWTEESQRINNRLDNTESSLAEKANQSDVSQIIQNFKVIKIFETMPTSAQLAVGEIGLVYPTSIYLDTLETYDNWGSGATLGLTGAELGMSLQFVPTSNIDLASIHFQLETRGSSLHNTGNNIRVRICPDDGTGKPNLSNILTTKYITNVPSTPDTLFIGSIELLQNYVDFTGKLSLLANQRYHFFMDIETGTGLTYVSSKIKNNSPTNDSLSYRKYNKSAASWEVNDETKNPAVKIYVVN